MYEQLGQELGTRVGMLDQLGTRVGVGTFVTRDGVWVGTFRARD